MSFSSQGHLETEEGGEDSMLPPTCLTPAQGVGATPSHQGERQEVRDKVLELRESTGPTDGRHPGEKVSRELNGFS